MVWESERLCEGTIYCVGHNRHVHIGGEGGVLRRPRRSSQGGASTVSGGLTHDRESGCHFGSSHLLDFCRSKLALGGMVAQLPPLCHPPGSAGGASSGPPGWLLPSLGLACLLCTCLALGCARCLWLRWQGSGGSSRRVCLPSGLVVSVPDGAYR